MTAPLQSGAAGNQEERMSRFGRKLALVAGMVGVAGLIGASPAVAAGTATIQGAGTISPGLTTVATPQSFTFSGQAVVVANPGAGVYSCTFSGSSNAGETVATGAGTGSGDCSGPGSLSASFSYTRAGGTVVITGTVSGTQSGTVRCSLGFAATTAPTVTAYRVAGQCVLA
jgi:hypothetical protein